MNKDVVEYQQKIVRPIYFIGAMIFKLPSLIFWGVRVKHLDDRRCEVFLPFNRHSQNPFKSIYFAALAGAAELSTGILCQMLLINRPAHSMLVVDFKSSFLKKANTDVVFSCDEGETLKNVLDQLKQSGDQCQYTMSSVGKNSRNEVVVQASITWSFKRK